MGKTYRALDHGMVTQLLVHEGDKVERDQVIAKIMWTDEHGRSLTAGLEVAIKSPVGGIVLVFVQQGSQFNEGNPIFRII